MSTLVYYAQKEGIEVMDTDKGLVYRIRIMKDETWSIKVETFWGPAETQKDDRR